MKNLILFAAALFLCATKIFAQVPVYNSYPTAAPVIFLDFDGHYINGTNWNVNGPITCGPANMSDAQIAEIFNRVSEDYRPFNVNVTTDSAKYWAAPPTKRMRVVLTITSDWYGNNAGGVAYTGSFTWGNNTPCFIFTALLQYNTKYVSEAASHEAGHTFGLRHQAQYDSNCVKTAEYYAGVGSGETSWAPIMGVGYYRNVTTWHNGPNPFGCTNAQDDLSIITNSTNGIGYRTDDVGNTPNTATSIAAVSNKLETTGIISTNTDVDAFKISVPAGNNHLQMNVAPYSIMPGDVGSNLDLKVDLYNSKQKLITSYNPLETLNAPIDTTLDAGTYYVAVSGTGNNISTTSYASLGSYSIDGAMLPLTTLPLHKLALKGTATGTTHKLSWDIVADEKISKQVLEVSANGYNFTAVAPVANDAVSYSYVPSTSGVLQYRLNVTFDNGRQYFSNVIALRNNSASVKPQLFANLIHDNNLMVMSPAAFAYTITDFNGKLISKGQVAQGSSTINTGNLTNAMYLIRFTNGSEQYVEKFSKQ